MALSFFKLLNASAEYRVRLKNAPPSASIERQQTLYVYFWGLLQKPFVIDNCMGNGLSRVTIRKTLGQLLTGIITLGIIAPITVTWECAKDNMTFGT